MTWCGMLCGPALLLNLKSPVLEEDKIKTKLQIRGFALDAGCI
jgi:hypothetical protein